MNSEDAVSLTWQTHYTNGVSSGAEQIITRNPRPREEITNRAKYVKRKEGRGPYLGAWQYLLITTSVLRCTPLSVQLLWHQTLLVSLLPLHQQLFILLNLLMLIFLRILFLSQFLFSLAILSSHGFKNNYAPTAALSIHLQQCLSHCIYDNYILSHLSCPLARKLQEGWDHLPCSPRIPIYGWSKPWDAEWWNYQQGFVYNSKNASLKKKERWKMKDGCNCK